MSTNTKNKAEKQPNVIGYVEPVIVCVDDALHIAKGCFDYCGGYHNAEELNIYHHGIQTVINALEAAKKRGLSDLQVAAIYNIGKDV